MSAAPSEAHEHGHAVQFFDSDAYLEQVVADFLQRGLSSGAVSIAILDDVHRPGIEAALAIRGIDVAEMSAAGQLKLLDARATMATFLVDGLPDRERFFSAVSALLREAGGGPNAPPPHIYGEIVDVLWSDGNSAASVALEGLWNELGRRERFTLFCGYVLPTFRGGNPSEALEAVCEAHSQVIPADDLSSLSPGARLAELALLQQRARLLESEIAHRKQIEEALLTALAARDDFLSVASHELKTPLTTLRLQLQKVERRGATDPGVLDVQKAVRQVDRLAGLIDELLDVSQIRSGQLTLERTEVDLGSLARRVVDRSVELAERSGTSVQLQIEPNVVGRWDARRLDQVVSNLIHNALKYGEGRPIDVLVRKGGESALLSVRDRGVGIAVENHARIFERFERASSPRNFGGLGLGLWIVKRIVEAHGGDLRLQSASGEGATFEVTLPSQ